MDFITKALGWISPSAAFKRMQFKMAMEETTSFIKQRKYEGAGRGRRLGGWGLTNGSPNQDISSGLNDLRSRAVFLSQNNPYAKNAPKRIANNVVGTGILLSVSRKDGNRSLEDKFNEVWKQWAETTTCDFDDRLNFYGLQHLAMRTIHRCGEVIIRRVKLRAKNGRIPFELQVLDPDFIDTSKTSLKIESGSYIVNGVQFNSSGKKTHYWLFTSHPKEGYSESKQIPVKDICHIFDVDTPGQVRGVTEFASVINRMKDFDELEDAELYKQKIASCFVAFRSRPIAPVPSVKGAMETDRAGNTLDRMSPGIIQDLGPGEAITFGTPPSTQGFAEFSRQNLQGQAIGLGMSYESYTGDLSNVNFSSGRMGWIESFRNIENWQWNMMVPMFLQPVFEWFKEAALIAGFIEDDQFTASWTAPRREMIDPSKEIGAIIEAVLAGLISWDDAVKQSGYNPDELLAAMKAAKERFDAAGVLPTSDPRYEILLKSSGRQRSNQPEGK